MLNVCQQSYFFELFATKLDIAKLYLQLMKNLQKLKTDSGTEQYVTYLNSKFKM